MFSSKQTAQNHVISHKKYKCQHVLLALSSPQKLSFFQRLIDTIFQSLDYYALANLSSFQFTPFWQTLLELFPYQFLTVQWLQKLIDRSKSHCWTFFLAFFMLFLPKNLLHLGRTSTFFFGNEFLWHLLSFYNDIQTLPSRGSNHPLFIFFRTTFGKRTTCSQILVHFVSDWTLTNLTRCVDMVVD